MEGGRDTGRGFTSQQDLGPFCCVSRRRSSVEKVVQDKGSLNMEAFSVEEGKEPIEQSKK